MVRWMMFTIHSATRRTVPVVFVAEDSLDDLCDPVYLRVIYWGINWPILLAVVRYGRYLAVENLSRLVQCVA